MLMIMFDRRSRDHIVLSTPPHFSFAIQHLYVLKFRSRYTTTLGIRRLAIRESTIEY